MTDKHLETDRLVLRPMRYSDADMVEKFVSDADVAAMTANIPHPYPQGTALAYLERAIPEHKNGEALLYAITLKRSQNDLIGSIGIKKLNERGPEIWYWLGTPFWRRGLMSEALKPVVNEVFRQNSVPALCALIMRENEASKKVLLKTGFVETGPGTCDSPARTEKQSAAILFELRRDNWIKQQKRVI